ncbi:MAG: pseudouridine synthase [Pseudomonadota bacterium]
MAERRETGRPKRPVRKTRPLRRDKDKTTPQDWSEGERIAKYLARAGVGSRRACEALIEAGKVSINGERLMTPARKVTGRETIRVGRKIIQPPDATRLWRYHKPAGLITTNADPAGRTTIFEQLPKDLPRVVTIGRLDINTEGLLLLTNDGALARALELPKHAFERRYRARAFGLVDDRKLESLASGITVDGERFGAIEAVLDQETGSNNWLSVSLKEGKKREVRRALDAVGLTVNRLIRTHYGPFELADLRPGAVAEVPPDRLPEVLGPILPELDFEPEGRSGEKPDRPPPKSRFRKRR